MGRDREGALVHGSKEIGSEQIPKSTIVVKVMVAHCCKTAYFLALGYQMRCIMKETRVLHI